MVPSHFSDGIIMHYEFESANHIDDYLKAIKSVEEFFVKQDVEHGIQIINYMFNSPTTFPDTRGLVGEEHRLAVLRRDCRGIKFDLKTGDVITKPYHKFFNVGERPEMLINEIDWSQPHRILEKLDGSMITLYRSKDGFYQNHTKMGATDVAVPTIKFVKEHPQYLDLYNCLDDIGYNPIFEWCSRQQRIVIDYPKDNLIMTAIRHRHTGQYLSYEAMFDYGTQYDVPVVKALPGNASNIQEFLDQTKDLEDAEGYVLRFDNGHMCKIKGLWYMRIHNTKELFLFEKNVWTLVLNDELDDAKPFMDVNDIPMIESFATEMEQRILKKSKELEDFISKAKEKVFDKKSFALEIVPYLSSMEKRLAFKLWEGHNARDLLQDFLLKHSSTQRGVDDVREIVGDLNWNDFRN